LSKEVCSQGRTLVFLPVKVRGSGEVQVETTIQTIITIMPQHSYLLNLLSLCDQTSIAIMPIRRTYHSNASRILIITGTK
jgi:hypothetical protein